jgi:hypothetical protein
LMVRALDVISSAQEFEVLEIVADAVPPVTVETLDPLAVHPDELKAMAVDSALPPLFVRGGVNVSEPVMPVHVTPPVASVRLVVVGLALGLVLDPHAVASAANNPIVTTSDNLTVCVLDMARSPRSPGARRSRRARPRP